MRHHIQDIFASLNTEDILFPNSRIIAFSTQVRFREMPIGKDVDGLATVGTLTIAVPKEGEAKPGWIVDGQQRAAALLQSRPTIWPIPVNAVVAEEVELQRDRFLRVNNTKPLPRGLILELLPEVASSSWPTGPRSGPRFRKPGGSRPRRAA